ncbi:MAG: heavy metal translocating P-type ATPase [Candidatus Brocadia sp.]
MIKEQLETYKLIIEGMDCQDEVTIIEKKLKSLSGIKNFEIYLATQGVKVVCDPSLISIQQIIRSIAETGMRASVVKEARAKIAWWKEKRIIALSICGLFTLTAFILEKLGLKGIVTIILHSAAIIFGGYYPAKMAFGALKTLTLNIRTLMVTGAVGAVTLGLWEEAATLVFIYLLGDILEIYTVSKSRGALKMLMELAPKEALVRRNGKETVLPVEEVEISDTIIIRPGEKIPLDGKVIKGYSSVDQSPITGESIPAEKKEGDDIFAGTFNQRGVLEVMVTKLSKDTTLAKIIHSVEEAHARKSSYQRFGEKFGKYYTPTMFALAFVVATIPPLFWGGFSYWFYRGLVVLVVSCSCGIALSVPVAVVAAIGNAARHGVLVKGGVFLEIAAKLKAIAFDKTGTITIGKPSVTDIIPLNNNQTEETILQLAASIENYSEHPLGETIVSKAKERELNLRTVDSFESITGMGAKAKIGDCEYFIGNKRLFSQLLTSGEVSRNRLTTPVSPCPLSPTMSEIEEERGGEPGVMKKSQKIDKILAQISELENQGKTVILLGSQKELLGIIAVADRVRVEAKNVVQTLKHAGIERVIMLTGDNEGTAAEIARETGIDEFYAKLLPEDKVETVKRLKEKYHCIAMVGDGVNDAPAMAESDAGIAMGAAGTDIAIETSDFVLMSDDLAKIPYIISLSRRTISTIRQNIVTSLLIIAFLVPVALCGWIGLVPGLLINEIGGLIVIANGLRLLR